MSLHQLSLCVQPSPARGFVQRRERGQLRSRVCPCRLYDGQRIAELRLRVAEQHHALAFPFFGIGGNAEGVRRRFERFRVGRRFRLFYPLLPALYDRFVCDVGLHLHGQRLLLAGDCIIVLSGQNRILLTLTDCDALLARPARSTRNTPRSE